MDEASQWRFEPYKSEKKSTPVKDSRVRMRPFLERLQLGKGITMSVFARPKKVKPGQQKRWHYEFRVRGVRYRGSLPEARTKWQAEQAEIKLRQKIFEGKFGTVTTAPRLKDFI